MRHDIEIQDVEYRRHDGVPLLARLYRPQGAGPFPIMVELHGGAWCRLDRLADAVIHEPLARSGVIVAALDFRQPPVAPYPASLQDINYGIRWLKAHSREFGSSPERVGLYGTSSGGHQALLSALRPDDPRYTVLKLAEAPQMDAKVAFVVSGWGVLYPLERYKVAKATGNAGIAKNHETFFRDEQTQIEATPALILERGEKVATPPALVFQGTDDEWTSVELAQRFAADYQKAGGTIDLQLLPGERHTFVNEHLFAPNSIKAVDAVKAFIKKYGSARSTN